MAKFFLYLILFITAYYIIKASIRLFKLFISNNKESNFNIHFGQSKDNTIYTDKKKDKKKPGKDFGEYIDFEEVK